MLKRTAKRSIEAFGDNVLNVLMTATSYPAGDADWRGRFIYDMAESLASTGQVGLRLWAPPGRLPSGVESAFLEDDGVWLERLLNQGGIAHLLRRRPIKGGLSAVGLLRRLRRAYRDFAAFDPSTAVVHANWIQNALPLRGTSLPVLITVLGSDLALLRLPGMVPMVRTMLSGRAAILAPNADWMVPSLEKHFGDLAEIRTIPFGVHDRWFAVERQPEAIGSGDWLIVSRVTRAKLGHLLEWGEGLFDKKRKLHLLGPMQENIELPEWIEYHGPTNPEALATEWFPKVQGLLTLSTHDEGRPQVMIEAMAAGLPILATDLPAHRDLLVDGQTGCLVRTRDELVQMLDLLDDPQENLRIGNSAQSWVRETIGSWDDCAGRFMAAYDDLLRRSS
jgi:glycosyltransferase involved in cell wall biosynthesis